MSFTNKDDLNDTINLLKSSINDRLSNDNNEMNDTIELLGSCYVEKKVNPYNDLKYNINSEELNLLESIYSKNNIKLLQSDSNYIYPILNNKDYESNSNFLSFGRRHNNINEEDLSSQQNNIFNNESLYFINCESFSLLNNSNNKKNHSSNNISLLDLMRRGMKIEEIIIIETNTKQTNIIQLKSGYPTETVCVDFDIRVNKVVEDYIKSEFNSEYDKIFNNLSLQYEIITSSKEIKNILSEKDLIDNEEDNYCYYESYLSFKIEIKSKFNKESELKICDFYNNFIINLIYPYLPNQQLSQREYFLFLIKIINPIDRNDYIIIKVISNIEFPLVRNLNTLYYNSFVISKLVNQNTYQINKFQLSKIIKNDKLSQNNLFMTIEFPIENQGFHLISLDCQVYSNSNINYFPKNFTIYPKKCFILHIELEKPLDKYEKLILHFSIKNTYLSYVYCIKFYDE